MSRTVGTADPRSLMGLGLADRPRGARSLALVISSALHAGALLGLLTILAHKPKPAALPERAPILVRLSRPAAPAAAKADKSPEKRTPPKVRPAIVPPVPEVSPPAPEEPAGAAGGEQSAAAARDDTGNTGKTDQTGGSGDGPLQLKEVARAPTLVERVTPDYPRQARADHIQGVVLLRAVIGPDGRVERDQIHVVRSVPALDGAAIAALAAWRFTPAINHLGQPVRVLVEIPFEFTLS
jgi:protein TonB